MKSLRLILLFLLIGAAGSQAFVSTLNTNGNIQHWDLVNVPDSVHANVVNRTTKAVRYFIASDAFSTTNTAAEINAVRASFDQWQSIPGTHLKFEYCGEMAPGVDINTADNTNVVFWVKGSSVVNGGFVDMSFALGLTFTSFFEDNTLAEADIVLNGFHYNWFTDITATSNSGRFVEGVMLHELGHFIGLEHSPVGGATMLARGGTGPNSSQVGLSSDEVAAARFHYPGAMVLGAVRGQVTKSSVGVFGAVVILEQDGNVIAGSMSRTDGIYELSAVPPGIYTVRVTPLDAPSANPSLLRGFDIANSIAQPFSTADTDFKPSSSQTITNVADQTNVVNFAVESGAPSFRITHIRSATTAQGNLSAVTGTSSLRQGQSNYFVGVFGPNLPTSNAQLMVTGSGITVGETIFNPAVPFNNGALILNAISAQISIASNATPGLRTLIVTNGETAYANGFFEILPSAPDYNFDGFDDLYQRQYFPLFTADEAKPAANPDGDAHNNLFEYIAGTNPALSSSILKVSSVSQDQTGAIVTWGSVSGKKYQLFARNQVAGSSWQTVGVPVVAVGVSTSLLDPAGAGPMRFYRVQVLP